MRSLTLALCLVVGAVGCGDDSSNGGGGSGTFSCDTMTGGSHGCTDYSWTGGVYPTSAWSSACTGAGGTSGTGCVKTGAVGGCKLTSTSGAISVFTTTWFYTGAAADVMTACTSSGGTFVAP